MGCGDIMVMRLMRKLLLVGGGVLVALDRRCPVGWAGFSVNRTPSVAGNCKGTTDSKYPFNKKDTI